jgi:hypothetical protein
VIKPDDDVLEIVPRKWKACFESNDTIFRSDGTHRSYSALLLELAERYEQADD